MGTFEDGTTTVAGGGAGAKDGLGAGAAPTFFAGGLIELGVVDFAIEGDFVGVSASATAFVDVVETIAVEGEALSTCFDATCFGMSSP